MLIPKVNAKDLMVAFSTLFNYINELYRSTLNIILL